jgi:hypothetical protein
MNARHSYLAAAVIELLGRYGWHVVPEVSFSVYGERGFIDLLAWHAASRTLLVIELKTEIVDAAEMLGVLDRKSRLAARIARERGWDPVSVSTWLVIAGSSTNRARAKALAPMLLAALPTSARSMKKWLRAPTGRVAGITFFQKFSTTGAKREFASRQRVRVVKPSVAGTAAAVSQARHAA